MKLFFTQRVNTIIGTGLLASAALAASVTIVDVSANAEEEFIYLTVEHRLYKAAEHAGIPEDDVR